MEGFGGGGLGDIFGDIFGMGSTRSQRSRVNRGADLEMALEIDFEEAVFGVSKNIVIPRREVCNICKGEGTKPGTTRLSCPQCGGSGQVRTSAGFLNIARECSRCQGMGEVIQTPCAECRGQGLVKKQRKIDVKIPAGIEHGTRLRVMGEGEAGRYGGGRGNLYILIYVKKHPIFVREDNDILCEVPVAFTQATLGAEIDVPTLEGKVKMKVPAGTQSGRVFRLRGKGAADISGYSRGDELIRVIVEIPTRLTPRQKELLKEFDASGGGTTPGINSFVDKIKKMFK